jgi:radical SAM superfamily enzyme YgiQ (UPF0313 family)
MKKLNIYLADLRHNYLGYVSSDAMPLGIGYMKAVMDKNFPDFNIKVFAYPDRLEKEINEQPPDVLMLTNYTWNEALSMHFAKYTRQFSPDCLIVMGGPNISIETGRRIEFLRENNSLDLYALGEGDFFATELIQAFIESGLDKDLLFTQEIHSSVYKKGNEYVATAIKPRTKVLDDIPSPWLTGVMDQFFDGQLVPLFETNRGCPFSCSFCVQGTSWYTKVSYFSLERLRDEVEYIAKKISTDFPQQKMLRIADPNFGMYNRDVDFASYLGETQRKYNYPLLIDATTGKNKAENIIKTMEKVNGAMVFYQAVQSLDDEVLENIQRDNIKLSAYSDLQIYIKGRGLKSSSDLILGLPGESLVKHLYSLEKLINSGTDKLNNFQSMLLKGSELEMQATREKYGFTTMYRLLPKCHGIYFGEKVFDIEEITVATKDLSFDDYLMARKYHLVINIFWNFTRFTGILRVVEKFGKSPWEWIESILKHVSDPTSPVYALAEKFIGETKAELFKTKEEANVFYSQQSHFEELNSGETGDNLIYKYRTLALFYYWEEVVEAAIQATLSLLSPNSVSLPLKNLLVEYAYFIKYSYVFGKSKEEIFLNHEYEFQYDIEAWIEDDYPIENINDYLSNDKKTVYFELSETNEDNLVAALKIWSFNPKSFSMFIRRIHNDWLRKEIKKPLAVNTK